MYKNRVIIVYIVFPPEMMKYLDCFCWCHNRKRLHRTIHKMESSDYKRKTLVDHGCNLATTNSYTCETRQNQPYERLILGEGLSFSRVENQQAEH
ncbi:hypothetical protein ACN38_g11588 [Penicillium nordicum]|uniref:Uncharacterized protein n=1 Tax=Penicillium nordicum TaxID=229535 RepID=A0A0M8NUL9_9EURO|nr:hypothetical protein ACN38_g11588 [Penicillium nordicum]